ncbi:MAG TPA: MgtC/SapB family protein [Gemmatimonadaceae bacterium]|jgi:putative Mg2+ transporter-C (MgtC) family protein|nr:MgtC/SapB family protein [Gemmatimonadaceae bacterium]
MSPSDLPLSIASLTFDRATVLTAMIRVLITFVLIYPIAMEREREEWSIGTEGAGLRTFPLVGMGSCILVLLAQIILPPQSANHAQVLQGLITGIGFVGGGAIVKDQFKVRGTATAAGVWATAVLGAAVGYGRLDLAVVLGVATFVTLRILTAYERRSRERPQTPNDGAAG